MNAAAPTPSAEPDTRAPISDDEIAAATLHLVAERGAGKTICPSEVARRLGGPRPEDWRRLMVPVKRVAVRLAQAGEVEILRKGKLVADLDGLEGIYRLGLPAR